MVNMRFIILAAFVFLVSVHGETEISKNQKDVESKTTTPKPAPPTTSNPTTPPTPKPTPPPPTPKPTPPPAPPITTTLPPTTPAPPTSTTPLPPAVTNKWAYFEKNTNKSCVIVQMALQFNLTYTIKDGNTSYSAFDLPVTTNVTDGKCGNDTQFIMLTWELVAGLPNNMSLTFDRNTTTNRFSLLKLDLAVFQDATYFPGAKDVNSTLKLSHSGDLFTTPLSMSYRCVKMQNIILPSGSTNSTLTINDVQFQAFHTDKGTTFASASDCDNADVPDIVPIAVGCALGGLVLIVLIAYLVGRRRTRTQGYLSM